MLWDALPDRATWAAELGEPPADSLQRIAGAVLACAAHQSEPATDCRWTRVIFPLAADRMRFRPEHKDLVLATANYPLEGDLEQVRPFTRSLESSLVMADEQAATVPRGWIPIQWEKWMRDTQCEPVPDAAVPPIVVATTTDRVAEVRASLVMHCHRTRRTTAIDAEHDTVFGLALYSLDVLAELLRLGNATGINGRTAVRTLAEAAIVLAYLDRENRDGAWQQYRAYGAGQAKLAWLKFEERLEPTSSVTPERLRELAGEDRWQELVDVDLGNWAGTDLRKMSEAAGVKDLYDRYYSWPSTFVHAQWCAVRDAVFTICANPLHRFHRVPAERPRQLDDVVPDAVALVDRVLTLVGKRFPTFTARTLVTAEGGG